MTSFITAAVAKTLSENANLNIELYRIRLAQMIESAFLQS